MTPEIIGLIESLLVAPNAARSFLFKEILGALIQNIIVVWVFTQVLIGSVFQIFECAPVASVWFTTQYFFNLVSISYKLLFIPKMWSLRKNKIGKSELIRQLRCSLYTEEYIRNIKLSQTIVINYLVGGVLVLLDFFNSFFVVDESESLQILRHGIRVVIATFLIKLSISFQNNLTLENAKTQEGMSQFLVDEVYMEPNILKECAICLVEMRNNDKVSLFQCPAKHTFHSFCIKQWLGAAQNQYKNCPYCKQRPKDYD